MSTRRNPIFLIILAQLFGAALWFSANGVAPELLAAWGLTLADLGYLTSAVQLGFILGTVFISLSGLADRFPASRIFAASALAGALANAGLVISGGLASALPFRFLTGVALAGIYPIGMKLVVGWVPERAGPALGWMVGMLVLGTATPHLMRAVGADGGAEGVILGASGLAVVAAAMVALLGDGPHLPPRRPGPGGGGLAAFRLPRFRAAAFGYFGHMWELYAFWTLVPALALPAVARIPILAAGKSGSLAAFAVIGAGAAGCILGGWLSRRVGSARVAAGALAASGALAVAFPFLIDLPPAWVLGALMLWGVVVVADSPQFSALSAEACPRDSVGAALAAQNGIGFAISIGGITLASGLMEIVGVRAVWVLVPGPIIGLLAMRGLFRPG